MFNSSVLIDVVVPTTVKLPDTVMSLNVMSFENNLPETVTSLKVTLEVVSTF